MYLLGGLGRQVLLDLLPLLHAALPQLVVFLLLFALGNRSLAALIVVVLVYWRAKQRRHHLFRGEGHCGCGAHPH
jgi:hypothetical protein